MRKGYGPTGISFHYTLKDFMSDVALRDATETKLWVEVVIAGNTYTTAFATEMSETEMRTLYDQIDHVQITDGMKRYQLFTA